jgi:lipoyl synthase
MSTTSQAPIDVYRPGTGARNPQARSPEWVQLSTAAAITLGLVPGRMHRTDCTHCLNLLVTYPEGCRANCAYCGLARHREAERDFAERNFIRVDWPTVRYEDILARVRDGADRGRFQRMCISMITHPDSNADTFVLLERWRAALPQIPVSVLSNPTTLERDDLQRLHDLGTDIFTVALDAATPEIFERTRGKRVDSPHRWQRYWQVLEWAAEVFGRERFGVHLICGMGETEREMLQVVQRVHDAGGHSHLFAFFPERGSLMENRPAVPRDQWRRLQLARYLIEFLDVPVTGMEFTAAGCVSAFGLAKGEVDALIDAGTPFRTSGCPGEEREVSACNRPYGDSFPGDIRSYPFALEQADVAVVRKQLGGEAILTYQD